MLSLVPLHLTLAVRPSLTGEEIIEGTKKHAIIVWGKVLPFGAQVVASAAAYSVGITATQVSNTVNASLSGAQLVLVAELAHRIFYSLA